mgnify:CR=1 FL=1
MSKIPDEVLKQSVADMLKFAHETKPRGFLETIELQIGLKNYDTQKDKRFAGTIKLPHNARPSMTVCVIGDEKHMDDARALGLPCIDAAGLKAFKKNRKIVGKFAKKYDAFLASDTLIKKVPRLIGPTLNKMGKFPTVISHSDDIAAKVVQAQMTCKFQLKKVLCMGVPIANVGMSDAEITANILTATNFLVSLLKKRWQNIKTLHIKSTMGPSFRIY